MHSGINDFSKLFFESFIYCPLGDFIKPVLCLVLCEEMAKKFQTKQTVAAGSRGHIGEGEPVKNSMPQNRSVPAKLWIWLHTVVSNVTVEPVEFIYCLMTTTSNVVRDNLFLEKVCRLDMDYGEDVCYNLTHGVS